MIHPTAPAYSIGKQSLKGVDKLLGHQFASPGPIYDTSRSITNSTLQHSIGKSPRVDMTYGIERTPAPTDYNPQQPLKGANKHKIPQSSREERSKNTNPDAAWYTPNEKQVRARAVNYSMGCRYEDETGKQQLPGPGHYSPQKEMLSKKSSNKLFGTARRFSQVKLVVPGPGDYQIRKNLKEASQTIGTAERIPFQKQTPGPGQYHKKSLFVRNLEERTGKTFGVRLNSCFNSKIDTINAFNNYFHNNQGEISKKAFPKYSIGKDERVLFAGNKLPGPTDYFPEYERKEACHAVIPQASREEANALAYVPGPNKYNPEHVSTKGQYTIAKSKSMSTLNANPGVGQYEVDQQSLWKLGKSGNLIPKSRRTDFVSPNVAGVGDYNVHKIERKSMTIPKAERFGKTERGLPGPGDYHVHSTLANLHFYKSKLK